MDGKRSTAELCNQVTGWFKDAEILVDLLTSYIRKGAGRYTYFACTLNEETDAVGELLQQRSINAEQMERELRLMETILQPWQAIQLNKEHNELFKLAHAALQQFSTASGRYKNSTAFFALPDAFRDVLYWSHDVRAFYELTGMLNKNQSAQLKRAQENCPLSEPELNDFQTRLDSEEAQILSILEQRQQRETQQQLLQTLNRQPTVQPPAALNVVASYVPTNNPAQVARLQNLHNVFRDIRSPKQLTDSMAELGCVIYQLCQEGLLPKHDILQQFGQAAEDSKVRRPGNSKQADHCYQTLCIKAADIFSSRDRLLIRPLATDVMQTDWGDDYADQGHRFALFIGELLEQLQTAEPSKPADALSKPATAAQVISADGKPKGKTKGQESSGKGYEVKDTNLVFYCALKEWHKYDTGQFRNGPAPNKELANVMQVTKSAISKYFTKMFVDNITSTDDAKNKSSKTGYEIYCKMCNSKSIETYFHQREGKFSRNRQLEHDPADTVEVDD